MAERTPKEKNIVTDQKDIKTHGIAKKLKVGTGNQMNKDKKFHVVIQQLLDKYGEFSWENTGVKKKEEWKEIGVENGKLLEKMTT